MAKKAASAEKKLTQHFLKAMKKDFDAAHLPQKTRKKLAEKAAKTTLSATYNSNVRLLAMVLKEVNESEKEKAFVPPHGFKLVPTELSDHPAHRC